jgi:mycothiol system anti-sigma-R factor
MTGHDRTESWESDDLCREVVAHVWQFLDNELDPAHREIVQQHISDCGSCLDQTDLTDRLKSLLHRKCGGDVAPTELRLAVEAALRVRG